MCETFLWMTVFCRDKKWKIPHERMPLGNFFCFCITSLQHFVTHQPANTIVYVAPNMPSLCSHNHLLIKTFALHTHTHTRARILWCLHNIITHFIGWMFGNVFCFSRILFAWKCFLDCSWAVPMQTPAYVCYWWGWGVTQRYGVCHRVRKQQKAIIEGAFRYFPSFFFVDSTLFCSSHQFLICMSFHSVDACSHIDSRPPTAYNNIWWPHRFYCFILVSH